MNLSLSSLKDSSEIIISELDMSDIYSVTVPRKVDNRGSFSKIFNGEQSIYPEFTKGVCQINISETFSSGTVRGMHFQHSPCLESKIVFCIFGKVFDVAVDLRRESENLGKWTSIVLEPEHDKFTGVFIPPGFAHGFQSLSNDSMLLYVHSDYYQPEKEGGLRFDDPLLGINWPMPVCNVSLRDKSFPLLDDCFSGII